MNGYKLDNYMKKTYITTPIYYVNDNLHIGHAYTTILADVLNRFQNITGNSSFMLTGSDEHGQKVQEAAQKRNVSPIEHVDEYVLRFHALWEKLNIQHNDFIRTTEPRHKNRVKEMLNDLWEKEEIYLAEYEGSYSVSEERFITDKEIEEGDFKQIIKLKEKNYFFKMSKYQDKLINHINQNPQFIVPESRKNEILGFLSNPLTDLCISRPKSRLNWGIELPFDDEYVTYVWFDALMNYITAIGWNTDEEKFNNHWPADYHLVGKDIITTHAVYWPTMLMAAKLPLPKTILAHGWWLFDDSKMSKTTGNTIDPLKLIDMYGEDALRYYLMRDMALGQDANYSLEKFIKRYNSDLANDFGNLVNRVSVMIRKHYDSKIPVPTDYSDYDLNVIVKSKNTIQNTILNFRDLKIHNAIESVMGLLRELNKYLEINEPWKTLKNNPKNNTASNTLYIAINALYIGTQLLHPIMPRKTLEISKILGSEIIKPISEIFDILTPGTSLGDGKSPFPRIEEK